MKANNVKGFKRNKYVCPQESDNNRIKLVQNVITPNI